MGGVGAELVVVEIEIAGPNTGQLLGQGGDDVGHQAGDQVHLVAVCDGQDDLGLLDPGLLQGHRRGAGPVDGLNIDAVGNAAKGLRILVDDHHILVFVGQVAGNVETDLTGPDNDDLQADSFPAPCA